MTKQKRYQRSGKRKKNSNDGNSIKKEAKEQEKTAEDYIVDAFANSPPEMKKKIKELKKYPLIVTAVSIGHEKAIDLLLEIGHSLNVQIADGSTPLILAIERGHSHLINKLLEAGANPNILRKDGSNALMVAVDKSDITSFNILWRWLDKTGGCDLNYADKQGNTLLILAAKNGWEAGLIFLLSQKDININHQTLNKKTALMMAVSQGHPHIAEKLVRRGSDLMLEDLEGATAICCAVSHEYKDVAHSFYRHMGSTLRNEFVKRRVELLSSPVAPSGDQTTFYKEVLFLVLLDIRHNMEDGVEYLHKNHIFTDLINCAERNQRDVELLRISFHLIACLIHDKANYSKYIVTDLAEQFVEADGPEFLLKVIKNNENNAELRISAVLPIQAVAETEKGEQWIRSNFTRLLPFVSEFSANIDALNYWYEGEKTKVSVMWERFVDILQSISSPKLDLTIATTKKSNEASETTNNSVRKKKRQQNNKQDPAKLADKCREQKQSKLSIPADKVKCNFDSCYHRVNQSSQGTTDKKKDKYRTRTRRSHVSKTVNQQSVKGFQVSPRNDGSFGRVSREDENGRQSYPFSTSTPSSSIADLQNEWKGPSRTYAKALLNNLQENKLNCEEKRGYDKSLDTIYQRDGTILDDSSDLLTENSQFSNKFNNLNRLNDIARTQEHFISGNLTSESLPSYSFGRGDRMEPDGRSDDNSNILKAKSIRNSQVMCDKRIENEEKPDQYVQILLEVIKNMMEMLMGKAARSSSKGESMIFDKTEWTPRSERWGAVLRKMVAETEKSRVIIGSTYYIEQKEYTVSPHGKFQSYVGLTKNNKEVIVKKVVLPFNSCRILGRTGYRLSSEVINHKNVLPLLDVSCDFRNGPTFLIRKLCEYNIQEYIPLLQENNLLPFVGKELIKSLLDGLKYLHEQQILHGRLKPTNIQINIKGRLLLSDFGLLEVWPPLCGIIPDYSADKLFVTSCSWRPQECVTAITTAMAKASYTLFSDMQVAGMLIYFIISGGYHPYGSNDNECQVNIVRARSVFPDMGNEVDDLINCLLSHDSKIRPTASTALNHPYFWYSQKRLDFLIAVASLPEFNSKYPQEMNRCIEKACFDTKNWMLKVHPHILRGTCPRRTFKGTTSDLLHLIFYSVTRYSTLSREVQTLLNSPALYFTERFPTLIINLYKVLRHSHWKCRQSLSAFF